MQSANIIDKDVLEACIADYKSRSSYSSNVMNKADPGESLAYLMPFIAPVVGAAEYRSGNFYKHSTPYLPHTDYRTDQDNDINVVIPLSYEGERASLVVFDQTWDKQSVTWCLDAPLSRFEVNTGVPGYPSQYDVKGLTGLPVDDELYKTNLRHYRKECFFGLSGEAYPFEPGTMIVFDNRRIHCTSNFKGEKLGISLRFKRNASGA